VHEGLYDLFEDAEIVAPPLRERGADVDELAAAFLERACPLYGRAVPELGAEVRKALRAYDWPGNVRELEQVVDRVVDGLPGRGELCANDFPAPRGRREGAEEVLSMAEVERQAIGAALDRFGRDTEGKRQAAEALGIGIATLYRKLKRYEVS
jgi:DNA-binding NtrC family response regulator